jgi:hypothetical protein
MAAGLGFIEFTTGDVLTAADANGYLASQVVMVFADAAARTTAITSPQEGMMSFRKDADALEYYSGAAWVAVDTGTSPLTTKGDLFTFSTVNARLGVGANGTVLTADSAETTGLKWATPAAGGGITLITSTDMAGVASVTFSSIVGTYKNLIVIVKNFYLGTDFKLKVELNSDSTSSNYEYVMNSGRSSGAFVAYSNTNNLQDLTQEGADSDAFMYLFFPDYTNTIARKQIQNNAGFLSDNGGVTVQTATHQWRNTSAITDIKILNTLASNFTAGTVELYGVN